MAEGASGIVGPGFMLESGEFGVTVSHGTATPQAAPSRPRPGAQRSRGAAGSSSGHPTLGPVPVPPAAPVPRSR